MVHADFCFSSECSTFSVPPIIKAFPWIRRKSRQKNCFSLRTIVSTKWWKMNSAENWNTSPFSKENVLHKLALKCVHAFWFLTMLFLIFYVFYSWLSKSMTPYCWSTVLHPLLLTVNAFLGKTSPISFRNNLSSN